MNNDERITELWSLRINPSDLLNIERPRGVNPDGGGGQTYIQIPMGQKQNVLRFLRKPEPSLGQPVRILVSDQYDPAAAPQLLEFSAKSAGRMRISRQNRHRAAQSRLHAWTPLKGFPALTQRPYTTPAAEILLDALGGLHIYLTRTVGGTIWAGFAVGPPTTEDREQPFADIVWGTSPGGYWTYNEKSR